MLHAIIYAAHLVWCGAVSGSCVQFRAVLLPGALPSLNKFLETSHTTSGPGAPMSPADPERIIGAGMDALPPSGVLPAAALAPARVIDLVTVGEDTMWLAAPRGVLRLADAGAPLEPGGGGDAAGQAAEAPLVGVLVGVFAGAGGSAFSLPVRSTRGLALVPSGASNRPFTGPSVSSSLLSLSTIRFTSPSVQSSTSSLSEMLILSSLARRVNDRRPSLVSCTPTLLAEPDLSS